MSGTSAVTLVGFLLARAFFIQLLAKLVFVFEL